MKDIITIDTTDIQEMSNRAEEVVLTASQPIELAEAILITADIKDKLKMAKKALKDAEENPKAQIKAIAAVAENLESQIKDRFSQTYETETVIKQKTDEETGEVTFKEYENTNKGKKLFTYTAPKKITELVVDMDQITHETHPHLFKQEWVLQKDLLKAEDIENLPTKTKTTETPEKIGIQWKAAQDAMKGLK